MAQMEKVDFPVDKRGWHPSLIPGPVVLISTYGPGRQPNVAPKSWLQMVAFDPPTLMFSGTEENTTEQNIIQRGCFGVNLIDSSMTSRTYRSIRWFGRERIEKAGFEMVEAARIDAPLVEECRANLECRLHHTIRVGSGFVVFGEIVAAAIWEDILHASPEKRYRMLDQVLYLEEGLCATVTEVFKV